MRRLLGALLVSWVALVGASCGDGGADDDEATSTTDRSTTTSTAPPTTTTSTTEPVPFDVEVRRAAIELLEVRNDVFMHPDVTRVSEYIADTCTCLERERAIVDGLVRSGRRWVGANLVPIGITLDLPSESSPTLTLVARQPQTSIVNARDEVEEEVPDSGASGFRVSLTRSADGAWRLNLLDADFLNDETVERVSAVGLP
jgi:hypothetical protein